MENTVPATIEQLPFDQFKLLGMEKKDVLSLPKRTLDALLSGNRTSLIQFNGMKVNGMSEPATVNAKLSMQKVGDSYQLKMHPVNLTPKNDLELSQKEIAFLKKDPLNILPKMVVGTDGKLVDSFISLDQTTNEFVAVKRDKLRSPESINDVYLSEAQKKDFVNGKPIQLGNEKYQMDVNSETGVSGNNIQKMLFKTGEYNAYNALLDAALIVSGLGIFVMVEHIAKLAFNNREKVHELMKQDLKPAIRRTVSTMREKIDNGVQLTNKEKNDILLVNIKDTIKLDNKPELSNEPIVATKSIAKAEHDYTGILLGHGKASFEFKEENKGNYFIKLGTDNGDKLVWGMDFARAIDESSAKVGDQIGIDYKGSQPVSVESDIKDVNGKTIAYEEKTVERNNWIIEKIGQGAKVEQKIENIDGVKNGLQPISSVIKDAEGLERIFHIKLDATKDINEQKALASSQIITQLDKYDGKGQVVVMTQISAGEINPGLDVDPKKAEQDAKINQLKTHINSEIHNRVDPVRIINVDEVVALNSQQQITNGNTPVLGSVFEKNRQQIENISSHSQNIQTDTAIPINLVAALTNHFHVKVDASKNLDEQKLAANSQISAQLGNYDGKGRAVVHREFDTKHIDRSDTEGKMAFSFQEVMIARLQEHITREVQKQTTAVRIATTDEIKIVHPEQRQANETKPVLEKDNNKQMNIAAKSTVAVKNDNDKIEVVKKGMKR